MMPHRFRHFDRRTPESSIDLQPRVRAQMFLALLIADSCREKISRRVLTQHGRTQRRIACCGDPHPVAQPARARPRSGDRSGRGPARACTAAAHDPERLDHLGNGLAPTAPRRPASPDSSVRFHGGSESDSADHNQTARHPSKRTRVILAVSFMSRLATIQLCVTHGQLTPTAQHHDQCSLLPQPIVVP